MVCGSETPLFISKATNANRYDWIFEGSSITSVADTIAEHKYNNLGLKNIMVTPMYNGCAGTPINFQIRIKGVIAKFKYANTCGDKKTFKFENNSLGNISTIAWNLGDNALSNDPDMVMHTYPQAGAFQARLDISDNITGCVDAFLTKIYTANPILQNPDRSICINTNTSFAVSNNYTNPALTYEWNVVGIDIVAGRDSSPVIYADVLDNYNNHVILNNGPQYCRDTIQLDHPITVRGPKLDFTAPTNLCLNTPLTVTNLSHAFEASDSIKLWYWNFGRVHTNDTIYQPAPYTYTTARAYYVKLTAVDIHGCTDTLTKRVVMRPMPFLWIIPKMDTVCAGQSSTLIGYTSDEILWKPASTNFCTTCDTTTVRPTETMKYYATATNRFNCTATDSAMVKVLKPFTANALTPDTSVCAGEKIMLDVEPKDKVISWSPAASLTQNDKYDPYATPVQTTVYRATLTDSAGCFSSTADITLSVRSKPTVRAGEDRTYPYNGNFTFRPTYSENVRTYLWTPADSLTCTTCPNPGGIATTTKTYSAKIGN